MEWIKCSDEVPDNRKMVLLVAINQGPKGSYTTDMYCGWRNGYEWSRWPHPFKPTHWLPLPEPPK